MNSSRFVPTLIVGGGIIGSAIAYFLAARGAGREVVVLEPDATYAHASTPRSASAIRTGFHLGSNVALSLFSAAFFQDASQHLSVDGETVDIGFQTCPYLMLCAPEGEARMEAAFRHQREHGARVDLLRPDAFGARLPWLRPEGLGAATLGLGDEGWFEPLVALRALRRKAQALGVTYLPERAVAFEMQGAQVQRVRLAGGSALDVGRVVNAAGARSAEVAAFAGVTLPIESRRRTAFVFRAGRPPEGFLNLVDPTYGSRGVYARPYRGNFMAVTSPEPANDPHTRDLTPDLELFDEIVRPALARRVRGFEDLELIDAWAGHYEINTFDQNAILGAHPDIDNLIFACGLSGHGVMHAPAIGRGIAEWILNGTYQTQDLTPYHFERIAQGLRLDDVQASEARQTAAGV